MSRPPAKAIRRPPSGALLRLVFLVGVVPAAWVLRVLRIDRLGLRPRPGAVSYWSMRADAPVDLNSQA